MRAEWARECIAEGLSVIERILENTSTPSKSESHIQRMDDGHIHTTREDVKFSFGGQFSLADVFLIPQVYNALRWFNADRTAFSDANRLPKSNIDLLSSPTSPTSAASLHNFPRISEVYHSLTTNFPPVVEASPERQSDAPERQSDNLTEQTDNKTDRKL